MASTTSINTLKNLIRRGINSKTIPSKPNPAEGKDNTNKTGVITTIGAVEILGINTKEVVKNHIIIINEFIKR